MKKRNIKPAYKIKILLSQTTLTDYKGAVQQDRIFFIPQDQSHLLVLAGEHIYTSNDKGILIKIHQN